MTQHSDSVRLRHMLELALVRLIEIIGEAAARVSEPGKGWLLVLRER